MFAFRFGRGAFVVTPGFRYSAGATLNVAKAPRPVIGGVAGA
jgi:hypothetical protein